MAPKDTLVEPNCVVIPMDMDSKEKILVGNINLKLGYLDNVHEADISIGKLVNLNVLIEVMIFTKLYMPNTLNIDYLLWHIQLIFCAKMYNFGSLGVSALL